MKVLLVTSMAIPHVGGASSHYQLLCGALRRGSALAGSITGASARMKPTEKMRQFACAAGSRDKFRVGALRYAIEKVAGHIEQTLRQVPVQVIHSHDTLASVAAAEALARQGRSAALLQTVHGPWTRELLASGVCRESLFFREAQRIEKEAFLSCDSLIAVDQGQASILSEDFLTPPNRLRVVRNAVDFAAVQTLAERRPSRTFDGVYFVVPRRLVPKNGVHVPIDALSDARLSGVQLLIAGDGPLSKALRARAASANVADRVRFCGELSQQELMPLVARSAGVIVPSVPAEGVVEATSLAVIEAFACRVPVIASNIGGLAELVGEDGTGLLFPAGDSRALAEAVHEVLTWTAEERLQVCMRTEAIARRRYDVSPWFDCMWDIYTNVWASAPTA